MNLRRLKSSEQAFFKAYPGGFDHPEMIAIGKKHKVDRLSEFCQSAFASEQFSRRDELLENWIKVIGRSSMTSVFEKPKFKGFINSAIGNERNALADGLYEQLHGNQAKGWSLLTELFKRDKLAKWTLISAVPAYYRLQDEVFMKPNTVKGIVAYFELQDLVYKPTPSWDFYQRYRDQILAMKAKVDGSLTPNNPAFCGFLMMSVPS